MDTKKLRQKILDLAIRGKLVPQDPNDEPASVLLERIKAEKERLIQEGKIKRPKKSTADTSHYQNFPFDIPESWEWVTIGNISDSSLGKMLDKKKVEGTPLHYLRNVNVRWESFDLSDLLEMPFKAEEIDRYSIKKGDLVICEGGEPGRCAIWNDDKDIMYQKALHRLRPFHGVLNKYLLFVLMQYSNSGHLEKYYTGSTIKHLTGESLSSLFVPIPPYNEQQKIICEIEKCLDLVGTIEKNNADLQSTVNQAKAKVLDLAIHGQLVSQKPEEEPAIELLKRINPNIKIPCDNPHYQKLPDGWSMCRLEDIVDYEQPQAYIVESTDYSDDYDIPVLTAGKTFVIGYTNEETGICDNLPVIIFDDFTTDSKYVEFPFKVKSSAMKILRVRRGINIKYVAAFMAITKLIGKTHKRYWISEYSKIEIPIPPQKEQERIIMAIEQITAHLNSITTML